MAYLRHASRHLQRTVEDRLRAQLNTLGWLGPSAPFGTTPITILSRRVRDSELTALTGNIVGIFFGQEGEDTEAEMGGGMLRTSTDLFVDVVAVNDPIGLALASDVKDFLTGRATGTSRLFAVSDYTADPAGVPRSDYVVEVVDVSRERPDNTETRMFWQVVTATLEMTFSGEY
jgi:hypothetical protein